MPPFTFRRTPLGLRYSDPTDGSQGGGSPRDQGTPPADHQAQNGFPADTPLAEMTTEQQLAYWRYHSRKHEAAAKTAVRERDELAPKAARLDQLENANKSDEQKRHEQELEDARRNGENLGSQRYLRDAVVGSIRAATGKSLEDVDAMLTFADPAKFVTDSGDIDHDGIDKFVKALGASAPETPDVDPVARALRLGGGGSPASGGSVAAAKKAYRDAHPTTK